MWYYMKEWCFDKIYSDNLNVEEYQGCVTGRRGPQTGSCMTGSVAAAADRASLCFCSEACLPSPTPDCSVQRWLLATNMSKEHTGASLRATRLKQEVNEMPCIRRPNYWKAVDQYKLTQLTLCSYRGRSWKMGPQERALGMHFLLSKSLCGVSASHLLSGSAYTWHVVRSYINWLS